MSWLNTLFSPRSEARSDSKERSSRWWGWDFLANTTTSGISVNSPEKALAHSAWWDAVNIISGDAGLLPLVVHRRTDQGKQPVKGMPEHYILHDRPNPLMDAMAFRQTLTAHALARGNGYAEIEWDGAGRIKHLWPIPPSYVTPVMLTDKTGVKGGEAWYLIEGPGITKRTIKGDSIIHIHGLGDDGLRGYSVISMAKESLGLGLACEKFGSAFFGNGSRMSGILTHPGKLGEETIKNLRDSFEHIHAGLDNAHRVAVLEEGIVFKETSIAPEDAQFLETRHFQVCEIARWFGIPAFMLEESDKPTYASVELRAIEYATRCLMRWLKRWESECSYKLFGQFGQKDLFAEFNTDALLRGDTASRYAAYSQGITAGWLKRNEVREKENLNADPELDKLPPPGAGSVMPGQEEKKPAEEDKAPPPERFLPLYLDLARRATTREVNALRKDRRQPGEFWRKEQEIITDSLSPVLLAAGYRPELAGKIAAEHCEARRLALEATNGNLKDVLDDWERHPDKLAKYWLIASEGVG